MEAIVWIVVAALLIVIGAYVYKAFKAAKSEAVTKPKTPPYQKGGQVILGGQQPRPQVQAEVPFPPSVSKTSVAKKRTKAYDGDEVDAIVVDVSDSTSFQSNFEDTSDRSAGYTSHVDSAPSHSTSYDSSSSYGGSSSYDGGSSSSSSSDSGGSSSSSD